MTGATTLWPQDPWGRVLNGACDASELPALIQDIAHTAADLAFERFGDRMHSVYLSGDLARDAGGEAAFIIVLRNSEFSVGLDLFCAAAALRVQKLHPELHACTFETYGWDEVFPSDGRFSPARFRIGVNSVAVAGRDLKRLIAPQKLTSAVSNASIVGLSGRLRALQHRLKAVATESRVRASSKQFAQTSLKGAFACVMSSEQVYTEDFATMARYIALSVPERKPTLVSLVGLAQHGTASSLEALALVDEVMSWLPDFADSWLDQNNPTRDQSINLV